MPNLRRTPDAQIAQRSAAFSIASEALKPAVKRRTALESAGPELETGRRLRYHHIVLQEVYMAERSEQQSTTSLPRWVRISRVGLKFMLWIWGTLIAGTLLGKFVDVLFSDKPIQSLPNLQLFLEAIINHPLWA